MVHEFGTEQVNQKLCEKEESGYQSNITERNMVVTVKFQKKKRCEVCRNSLCDKTHITGYFCLMVVIFLYSIHFLFSTPNVFNSFTFNRKMFVNTCSTISAWSLSKQSDFDDWFRRQMEIPHHVIAYTIC